MNLTDMYTASPDWLKLLMILSPCLTAIALMSIWAHVRLKTLTSTDPDPLPETRATVEERMGEAAVDLYEWKKSIT